MKKCLFVNTARIVVQSLKEYEEGTLTRNIHIELFCHYNSEVVFPFLFITVSTMD